MASEKITAIVESVKTMTVLELKELVDTICEEALLLPLRRRRPSLTSSWLTLAPTRCRSSRPLRS